MAEARADAFGVAHPAGIAVPVPAIEAVATADSERRHHAAAGLDLCHSAADLVEHSHNLRPDAAANFQRRAAILHRQVAAAGRGGRDLEQRVRRAGNPRHFYVFHGDATNAFVQHSFYGQVFLWGRKKEKPRSLRERKAGECEA